MYDPPNSSFTDALASHGRLSTPDPPKPKEFVPPTLDGLEMQMIRLKGEEDGLLKERSRWIAINDSEIGKVREELTTVIALHEALTAYKAKCPQ